LSLETIINKGQSNTVNIEKDAHTLWINSNKNNDTKVTYTFHVPEKKYFSDLSVQGFSIQVKADDDFGFKSIQIKGNKLVDSHIHGSFYQLSLHCNKVKNSHIYWTGGLDQSLSMKYALNRADNFYLYLTKNIPYYLHGYKRNIMYHESGINIYEECRKGSGLIVKKL
jgi:hypothetical protein